MVHVVSALLLLVAFDERDPFRIRAPLRPRTARACRIWGQLFLGRAWCGLRDEELVRRLAIGIFTMIAHEGDASAVRRPCRRAFVPFALRESIEFLRGDVVDVDVRVTAAEQVACTVLFVPVTIDDDGFRNARSRAGLW